MRLRVLLAAVAVALTAPGMAHAAVQTLARPHLYHPNPVFTGIQLDYVNPLPSPTHGVAILNPLSERATAAAVLDEERLAYQRDDDLGGFIPAPIGELALSSGGHAVVGSGNGQAQIPLFEHHAGGQVNAFTFIGSGPAIGPGNTQNGKQPVPGLGIPVPVPPASNNSQVPPANGGFSGPGQTGSNQGAGKNGAGTGSGGNGKGKTGSGTTTARGGTGKTTTSRPRTTTRQTTTRRTTTQATVSTTTPTTTSETTTTGGGGGGGGGGGSDCGSDGISIVPGPGAGSDCIMRLFHAKPGDEEHEVLTITNSSDAPYVLALRVTGSQNRLWHDLEMGVWVNGTPTPSPLPPLTFWTTQYNDLVTLHPGDSISYKIELFLPVEAGNVDQSLTAIINFNWEGH